MKALVFIEQRDGRLKSSSCEALSVAAGLCGDSPGQVAGVLIGRDVAPLVSALKGKGVGKVYVASHDDLEHYNSLSYTRVMERAVSAFQPDVLLGMATPMGRDLFPRLAARLDAGLLTDLTAICDDQDFSGGVKPMYAGKILARVRYQGSGLKMATLRPNVFPLREGAGDAVPEVLDVSGLKDERLQTIEVRQGRGGQIDLAEATRVISGGRAMGNAENFAVLHACAEVLQAAVGASRAAVDAGYASHDMQVGQTGKTVNPGLYIACGISGAIQHLAGMKTSRVIVAINTDPDAAIFSVADYGIVADLFEAVPLLTEKLRALSDS
ncbi:MAG: electron transfer flavoprotein subunit alpha/FixB family protein [Deltaproteobacteria bacterium]|nr:electron transfer flavoprotein subunit alpha/FixB family protein [Deltaproteobacteria bacterium]